MNKANKIRELERKLAEYEMALRHALVCPECNSVVKTINLHIEPEYISSMADLSISSCLVSATIDDSWRHDNCPACGIIISYKIELNVTACRVSEKAEE